MNKKSLIIGISVTLVWFLGITIFCILKNFGFEQNNLNSLGDFLAGIFAPVAFFWLILGYVQQGKQLDQNTKALEQQERALQLQIDEMRENVEQQKNIVLLLSKEREEAKTKIKPQIQMDNGLCLLIENERFQFNFDISNRGVREALETIVICESDCQTISKLSVDLSQKIQLTVPLKAEFKRDFNTLEYNLEIHYKDILGNSYHLEKLIIIENNGQNLRHFKIKFS